MWKSDFVIKNGVLVRYKGIFLRNIVIPDGTTKIGKDCKENQYNI